MAAGWPGIFSARQEANPSSQSIWNVVLYRVTKSLASDRLSWVPRPTTVRSAACCRANCSTPGASARQDGQCGAQNHTRSGLSAGGTALRSIFVPAATSLTTMEGNAPLATPGAAGPAAEGGNPPSAGETGRLVAPCEPPPQPAASAPKANAAPSNPLRVTTDAAAGRAFASGRGLSRSSMEKGTRRPAPPIPLGEDAVWSRGMARRNHRVPWAWITAL